MEHHHAMKNFQQNKAGREQNYIDGCTVYVYRVRPTMEYHSKTYRLDEEVVGAIERAKAGGTTPNRFLRELMGLNSENGAEGVGEGPSVLVPALASVRATSEYDPASIPGVSRGVPPETKPMPSGAFRVMCQHCGKKFGAETRRETTCVCCEEKGHKGTRYDCEQCRLDG